MSQRSHQIIAGRLHAEIREIDVGRVEWAAGETPDGVVNMGKRLPKRACCWRRRKGLRIYGLSAGRLTAGTRNECRPRQRDTPRDRRPQVLRVARAGLRYFDNSRTILSLIEVNLTRDGNRHVRLFRPQIEALNQVGGRWPVFLLAGRTGNGRRRKARARWDQAIVLR